MSKSQQISYLRIGNSAIAWFYAMRMPVRLLTLAAVADGLSCIEVMISSGEKPKEGKKKESREADRMLRCVADLMWTTILLYAPI